jgi:hypothetical protein
MAETSCSFHHVSILERDTLRKQLATYAARFNATPRCEVPDRQGPSTCDGVCALFGVESYLDEGLVNHSLPNRGDRPAGPLGVQHRGEPIHPEQLVLLILEVLMR